MNLLPWARGTHVSPSTTSTPSTGTVDLTSDSGTSIDDDSESSLASPAPTSPLALGGRKGGAGGNGRGHMAPRIRRLSTNSLPTTSFPSPSSSPEPHGHGHGLSAAFASSLSLDLDYPSSPEDGNNSHSIHPEDATPTGSEERHSGRSCTLVEQMKLAAKRRDSSPLPPADTADVPAPYPTPPPSNPADSETEAARPHTPGNEVESTTNFVRHPRGAGLPRCAADLKDTEDPWWAPMERPIQTHTVQDWSSPPRRAYGSSSMAMHAMGHMGGMAMSMLPTADDFPALPSSPPHGQQLAVGAGVGVNGKRSRWHKKGKSSGGSSDDHDSEITIKRATIPAASSGAAVKRPGLTSRTGSGQMTSSPVPKMSGVPLSISPSARPPPPGLPTPGVLGAPLLYGQAPPTFGGNSAFPTNNTVYANGAQFFNPAAVANAYGGFGTFTSPNVHIQAQVQAQAQAQQRAAAAAAQQFAAGPYAGVGVGHMHGHPSRVMNGGFMPAMAVPAYASPFGPVGTPAGFFAR